MPLEMMAATTNNLGKGTPFAGNMLTFPIYRVDSMAYWGVAGGPSAIPAPAVAVLRQSRPNPFSGSTTIEYQLPTAGKIALAMYNVAGQRVRTLVDAAQTAGVHLARWDGRNDGGQTVSAGTYLYRLRAGGRTLSGKLVLVK